MGAIESPTPADLSPHSEGAMALHAHRIRLQPWRGRTADLLSLAAGLCWSAKPQGGTPVSLSALTLNPSDSLGAIVPSSEWLSTTRLTALATNGSGPRRPSILGFRWCLPSVVRGFPPQTKDDPLRWGTGADCLCPVPGPPSLGSTVTKHESVFPSWYSNTSQSSTSFVPVRFSLYTALFAAECSRSGSTSSGDG